MTEKKSNSPSDESNPDDSKGPKELKEPREPREPREPKQSGFTPDKTLDEIKVVIVRELHDESKTNDSNNDKKSKK